MTHTGQIAEEWWLSAPPANLRSSMATCYSHWQTIDHETD